MIIKAIGALTAGTLLGGWFIWQDISDSHLLTVHNCALSQYSEGQLSMEAAWIVCERQQH